MNIQNRPPAIEKAAAIQVVARKEVLREALTPYAFATESIDPTVMEPRTVDMIEAATIETVERPETRKVRQEPAREQMAKMPKKISTTQETNAMM